MTAPRVSFSELRLARWRPGVVARALLERWRKDDGARAEYAYERLIVDLDSDPLTERRLQYLKAFELGLKRPEVARLFRVSEETVKAELQYVYAALEARNVTQAVAEGIRRGLI